MFQRFFKKDTIDSTQTLIQIPPLSMQDKAQALKGKFVYNGEFNRCFISGNIQRISADRCLIYIKRTGSDEIIACAYKKGKNKLPGHFNLGDKVVFNGKLMQSINAKSNHHIYYVHSAFSETNTAHEVKNNCELTGYINSYKKIDDELVEVEFKHADKLILLCCKRNYRFMLYDFENKYPDLSNTNVYVHGHFKLDRLFVDGILSVDKAANIINTRLNT